MTDKFNLESLGKLKAEEPASIVDTTNQPQSDRHETSRPTKAAKSKREIMEELSRERFPWEE